MRKIIPFLFTLIGLLLLGSFVQAHGSIERTLPADGSEVASAPEIVQVWLDEAFVADTAEITVINSAGERVDRGEVITDPANEMFMQIALQPDLPQGAYIISASAVVQSDGHTAAGSSVFWIGSRQIAAPTAENSPSPAYAVMGVLLGMMIVAGSAASWLLFRPTAALEIEPNAAPVSRFPLE